MRTQVLVVLPVVGLLVTSCAGRSASVAGATFAPAVTAYSFPSGKGGGLISPGFPAVEGNLFQVIGGKDVVVTALGFEDERSPQQTSQTAIFDSSGNTLVVARISSADALADGYYWKQISPLTLMAGHEYYIGSLHGSGSTWDYIWNTHAAQVPPYIADLGTYFKVSATIDGGSWQFGGGTSQYGSGEIRHYVGNFKAQTSP